MGKARIHGSNAKIIIYDTAGAEVVIGEVDKFSAKNIAELKKSQPLGDKFVTSHVVHKGWELSFEGGKVDWNLASTLHGQDELIRQGKRSPYFVVKQKITFFDGSEEVWLYPSVTIYGYEVDVPIEEITEKFQGFCGDNRVKDTSAGTPETVQTMEQLVLALLKEEQSGNKK